jgi:hypothetical protein
MKGIFKDVVVTKWMQYPRIYLDGRIGVLVEDQTEHLKNRSPD